MKTVELTIFSAVILVFFLNIILEHLFNWAFRESDGDVIILPLIGYVFKTAILVVILYNILK